MTSIKIMKKSMIFFRKYYVIQKIPKLFFEAISVLTVSIFLFVLLKNSSSSDIIVKWHCNWSNNKNTALL